MSSPNGVFGQGWDMYQGVQTLCVKLKSLILLSDLRADFDQADSSAYNNSTFTWQSPIVTTNPLKPECKVVKALWKAHDF